MFETNDKNLKLLFLYNVIFSSLVVFLFKKRYGFSVFFVLIIYPLYIVLVNTFQIVLELFSNNYA